MPNERILIKNYNQIRLYSLQRFLTFNEFPDWFHETAMEERGNVHWISVPSLPIPKHRQIVGGKHLTAFPSGYLGQYLIEQTKDWAIEHN